MSLLTVSNVTKLYGANCILEDVSLQVYEKDRIGLIGANGTGKTTLMRIISGLEECEQGSITKARNTTVGYLSQEPELDESKSVHEEVSSVFAAVRAIESELRDIETKMASAENDEQLQPLIARHACLESEFEAAGGYECENKTEATLSGLGFDESKFDAPVEQLSGGEKSRLALAKLLLHEPNLLLLDEPTNHLDINAIEWLEDFLIGYAGGIIIVSHDRYFLDRVATRIIEIEDSKVESYRGSYSSYVEQKEAKLALWKKRYDQQQQKIAHEEDFIRRYMAGQRGKEARGRMKRLERLDRIEKPKLSRKDIKLDFSAKSRGGNDIVDFRDVSKWYEDLCLFEDFSFELRRGERMGVMGPNGAGKTTLLKIALGQESATSGEVKLGKSLDVAYYDQNLSGLNLDNTVFDEIWQMDPAGLTENDVRSFLGKFLFSGDDILKRIGNLSGGEQSRLILAKLIFTRPNFLVLDEPTNHLDIPSRTVLEQALLEFDGTVLTVSHDRYFLNRIVQKIIFIEDGEARLYLGDYSFFERKRAEEARAEKELRADSLKRLKPKPRSPKEKTPKKPKMSLGEIEAAIIEREDKLKFITSVLGEEQTYKAPDKVKQLKTDYDRISFELKELDEEWERR